MADGRVVPATRIVVAAIVLALSLAGCGQPERWEPLPVGTCVRASDEGTPVVPCTEPHTHRVVAVVDDPHRCPPETSMASSPADGSGPTECYALHRITTGE
jgi:hypothetical protein